MKDPFFLEPLPWLVKATQPFADYFSLPTLPIHVHEVLASALLYSVIYYPVSPLLSRLIVGRKYLDLPRKRRINWDAHVVSLVQSLLINGLALWVMFVDEERSTMDWQARMWGYTGAAGMIQGLAAGYFLWDLVVTSLNMDVFGFGTLAHAVSALFVFSLGFVRLPLTKCSVFISFFADLYRSTSDPFSTTTAASSSYGSYPRPSSTFTGSLTSWE